MVRAYLGETARLGEGFDDAELLGGKTGMCEPLIRCSAEAEDVHVEHAAHLDVLKTREVLDDHVILRRVLVVQLRQFEQSVAQGPITFVQAVPNSVCCSSWSAQRHGSAV